jgi:hypothetical protein
MRNFAWLLILGGILFLGACASATKPVANAEQDCLGNNVNSSRTPQGQACRVAPTDKGGRPADSLHRPDLPHGQKNP